MEQILFPFHSDFMNRLKTQNKTQLKQLTWHTVSHVLRLSHITNVSFILKKGSIFSGGHMREFTDEESNFAALLQRAMDLEGVDRDVVYQLVALLMKVMLEDLSSEDRMQQSQD